MKRLPLILFIALAILIAIVAFSFLRGTADADERDCSADRVTNKLEAQGTLNALHTPVASYFVWLDWDANAASDNVLYYTIYMGEFSNILPAMQRLGNQTSIQVIRNHPRIYARVSATNATGESPMSNEISFTTP